MQLNILQANPSWIKQVDHWFYWGLVMRATWTGFNTKGLWEIILQSRSTVSYVQHSTVAIINQQRSCKASIHVRGNIHYLHNLSLKAVLRDVLSQIQAQAMNTSVEKYLFYFVYFLYHDILCFVLILYKLIKCIIILHAFLNNYKLYHFIILYKILLSVVVFQWKLQINY